MTATYPKPLIKVDLPIAFISAYARREKSIRYRQISTLHIWWARRPLAACRAEICTAHWPDPADRLCPPAFRAAAFEAIEAFAEPVLPGRLSCAQQPHHTLATVLKPLLNLGRLDEAKTYQRWGYRLVAPGKQFVGEHAEHHRYSVRTGDLPQAKRMLERHLPGALESLQLSEWFEFLLAARLWAELLVRDGTRATKVRVPEGLPASDADDKSDVCVLGAWFAAEAQAIASRFDARNGTNAFQRQIEEVAELAEG